MTTPVPPKERPEWGQMIMGEIEFSYRNYVLQTQIHQMRKEIKRGKITLAEAIDDLYALCAKYALAVRMDFKEIFKNW